MFSFKGCRFCWNQASLSDWSRNMCVCPWANKRCEALEGKTHKPHRISPRPLRSHLASIRLVLIPICFQLGVTFLNKISIILMLAVTSFKDFGCTLCSTFIFSLHWNNYFNQYLVSLKKSITFTITNCVTFLPTSPKGLFNFPWCLTISF